MTPDSLFSIVNLFAMAAWLPMVVYPRARWTTTVVPVVAPALLAVVYTALIVMVLGRTEGGFSSLADVRALFVDPWALLAGWVHYLAFDLFVGGWEVRDAQSRGIRHIVIVPALVLTFLLGPAGLLLYLGIRRSAAIDAPGPEDVDRLREAASRHTVSRAQDGSHASAQRTRTPATRSDR